MQSIAEAVEVVNWLILRRWQSRTVFFPFRVMAALRVSSAYVMFPLQMISLLRVITAPFSNVRPHVILGVGVGQFLLDLDPSMRLLVVRSDTSSIAIAEDENRVNASKRLDAMRALVFMLTHGRDDNSGSRRNRMFAMWGDDLMVMSSLVIGEPREMRNKK